MVRDTPIEYLSRFLQFMLKAKKQIFWMKANKISFQA
jgi:hypothetical protein